MGRQLWSTLGKSLAEFEPQRIALHSICATSIDCGAHARYDDARAYVARACVLSL